LIGTLRREFLDRTLFWGQGDLELKLEAYQAYYNRYRCHSGLAGLTPAQRTAVAAESLAVKHQLLIVKRSRRRGPTTLPKHLSSDNDPLFRFHRWLANFRVLGRRRDRPAAPGSP